MRSIFFKTPIITVDRAFKKKSVGDDGTVLLEGKERGVEERRAEKRGTCCWYKKEPRKILLEEPSMK